MGKNSGITIKDIGRLAGVSHSTVSRALNDHPQVNAETRERIKVIAKSLNFEFNAGARSLSSRKTGIIGLIYPRKLDSFGCSLYTNELFRDIRHELEHYDLDVIMVEASNKDNNQSNIDRLIRQNRQNRVDGFLLVHRDIHPMDYALMISHKLPLIQLHYGAGHYNMDGIDNIMIDNRQGGVLAADALIDRGCCSLLCLGSYMSQESGEMESRFEGFQEAAKTRGVPCHFIKADFYDSEAGKQAVLDNPELFEKADGIFALTDILAFGCLTAFQVSGFLIPDQKQLIGFDDSPLCTMMRPTISSILSPAEKWQRLPAA